MSNSEVIDPHGASSTVGVSVGLKNQTHHNDGKKDNADKNKLANATANAAAANETATIFLRGFPRLKAKIVIEVVGVGKGSGKWYVTESQQAWHVEKGYTSAAKLTKGGMGGSSPGQGVNPGGADTPATKPKV